MTKRNHKRSFFYLIYRTEFLRGHRLFVESARSKLGSRLDPKRRLRLCNCCWIEPLPQTCHVTHVQQTECVTSYEHSSLQNILIIYFYCNFFIVRHVVSRWSLSLVRRERKWLREKRGCRRHLLAEEWWRQTYLRSRGARQNQQRWKQGQWLQLDKPHHYTLKF